jgi:hypothetical protein
MNAHQLARNFVCQAIAGSVILVGLTAAVRAQDTSQTTKMRGTPTHTAQVQSATVVYVSGNDLVVKMSDGQVRHITVPDSARATVDGQELSVHDLKPGMTLQRTITTTTIPEVVTTTRTINGKVWNVNPPLSVILTLPDGTNKQYKVPKGQKFNINGQQTDVFGLKKGMQVSATVITQAPVDVVAQQRAVTGSMPPPPEPPPADAPILVEEAKLEKPAPAAAPAPTPAAQAEPAPTALPKTASTLPLIGLVGFVALALGLTLRSFRLARSRG